MPGSEAEGARLLDAYLSAQESRMRQLLARLARCLLAHEWRTMWGNRLLMRLCVTQADKYFI